MSDRMPTQDWCEFIVLETRCASSSHREVIYGSSCGRWCAPGGAGYKPKSDSDHATPRYAQITHWSAGGYGGGGCCCMEGNPGGGGYASRTCRKLTKGDVYCYVHAHGGCCYPESSGCNGCFSLIREANSCCQVCNEGGRCGRGDCYFNYCCYDQVGSTTGCVPFNNSMTRAEVPQLGTLSDACPVNADYRFHTQYKESRCQNRTAGAPGLSNTTMPGGIGRRPWDANSRDDKNSIPGGNVKDNQFRNSDPTVNNGVCSSPQKDNLFYPDASRGHGYGFAGYVSSNCHWGCAAWMCGDHMWTWGNMDYDRTSGPAWLNHPRQSAAMTCGGYNQTAWLHCMLGGTGAENCWQNIRTVGYGSATATVCGAPCCCGGYATNGYINFKYR